MLPEIADQGRLHAYSSPFNFGHKALEDFWSGPIVIQEKIDGSQFSFGKRNGLLVCRSRKVEINLLDPGMFAAAVETAGRLSPLLQEGATYRGEFLAKPKHNTLNYQRTPNQFVILFDIDVGLQNYLIGESFYAEAERIGLEAVPTLMTVVQGKIDLNDLKLLLSRESTLGGGLVEGIVLKNYGQYGPDKKVLMAKLVSAEFQETHRKDWAGRNPGEKDMIELIIEEYANPVRWKKAVQHCREIGTIQGAPQDIPILMKEIATDVGIEAMEEIQARLFQHFWPKIRKGLTRGFPEFYKKLLLEESLGVSDEPTT